VRVDTVGMKRRRTSAAKDKRPTVLFVGSDPHCRIVLSHVVQRFDDVDLRMTDTHRDGGELVTSHDLVLIDDGWLRGDASAVINPLKRGLGGALIPVAVLSGDDSERIRLIRAGAVSLIAKPLRLAEVERSITTLLDLFSTP
jgi:DNA-binding response OmpR family regulator